MTLTGDEARSVLGVGPSADAATLRTAYRALLRTTHPDLSTRGDATARTVRLTTAYRTLVELLDRQAGPAPAAPVTVVRTEPSIVTRDEVDASLVDISLVDDATIGVTAPAAETLSMLVEAAHRLGDIAYLDRSAGLLEVVVEFIDAPTSSVVLSLQGRGSGTTEVFCTVEPLSGGAAPPSDAVTRLLLRTLQGEDPSA